ncbi:glycoside hydrolase family 38 C-terminal domain-containing protein [Candidatus Poribacteria bacterium]
MLHIDSVEPTVLFTKGQHELLQWVKITIENTSEATRANLGGKFKIGGTAIASIVPTPMRLRMLSGDRVPYPGSHWAETARLGLKIESGKKTYKIAVPDIRDTVSAEFILEVNGKAQDRLSMEWIPRKHWQVHMIPIAHHDLGYTDTIEGVLRKYCRIYEDVLQFCEKTDDWPEESKFRYMAEETWSIQHFIENSSQETLEKLGKYIREGRIEVPALFGNQISGMCGHEELIRLMYPSFRIHRKYGAPIRSGSITDVPGLSWGLPTVLAGAGVKYFFAGLPTYFHWGRNDIHTFWDEDSILREHGRPDAFRWRGPDGEEVIVFYQGTYGCWSPSSYEEVLNELPAMLNEMDGNGCPFSVMRYGGYGCGDNTDTDIVVSEIVREWNSKWAYPQLVVSTNSMFFEELEKQCHNLRVFSGELPHTDYAVGAVSSAKETSINRVTHDKLHSAEKFATIAALLSGRPGPKEDIDTAYDKMLLYDEHTWGSAYQIGHKQDFAWSEKALYAYRAAYLADNILSRSVDRIADSVSREEEGQHIVVFNSLSFQRTDLVNIPKFRVEGTFELVDTQTGETVPHQVVELDSPQAPVSHAAGRYARGQFSDGELFSLAFVAKDVPSMGYKTYRIVSTDESDTRSEIVMSDTGLENRFLKITLNPQTGTVESIYDKELDREIVDRDAVHQLNQLVVRWVKTGKQESPVKAEIRRGESGPVYSSLVISSQIAGCPQLTQEIILYSDLRRIDLANRVLKDSTPTMEVYFAFPFKMDDPDFRFEGPNSVIKPLRDQFPGSNSNYYSVQHWADVSDGKTGVTLSPIDSHLVEFGGLWPCYVSQAHHGATPPGFGADFIKQEDLTRGHMYSFAIDSNFRTNFQATQQGDMLFRYSITTHEGDWIEGKPRDFGWSIGNPLVPVVVDGGKEGTLPESAIFCQVDKPNVLLLTLKEAEDGDGIIIRLVETEGNSVNATATLPFVTISQAYLTNIVEENLEALSAQQHSITVPVKAFGITTIRIQSL